MVTGITWCDMVSIVELCVLPVGESCALATPQYVFGLFSSYVSAIPGSTKIVHNVFSDSWVDILVLMPSCLFVSDTPRRKDMCWQMSH